MISQQIKKQTMKKLIIAALALAGFSAASFAQVTPAVKKNDAAKMQVVKKTTDKKMDGKVVAMNKVTKLPAPVVPVVKREAKVPVAKTTAVVTKHAVTKTNPAALKKDGTPDKRFKANQGVAAGPLKKNVTADLRYKANKKHS